MDTGVGIIFFGGAVLATILLLISHVNGQAKLDREKQEKAKREAEVEEFMRWCDHEDEKDERKKARDREWLEREIKLRAEQRAAEEEAERKKIAKRVRTKHQKTRNVLRQAAEKRKARRLYPAGVVK